MMAFLQILICSAARPSAGDQRRGGKHGIAGSRRGRDRFETALAVDIATLNHDPYAVSRNVETDQALLRRLCLTAGSCEICLLAPSGKPSHPDDEGLVLTFEPSERPPDGLPLIGAPQMLALTGSKDLHASLVGNGGRRDGSCEYEREKS